MKWVDRAGVAAVVLVVSGLYVWLALWLEGRQAGWMP